MSRFNEAAKAKAEHFVKNEREFRLGALLTESSHPKTATLSQTIQKDVRAGIRMLLSVDEEIAPSAERVLASQAFERLTAGMTRALLEGGRIFFTGCGATGRLSILLEAAWREFWQGLSRRFPAVVAQMPQMEDRVFSVMAGGDYALIRAVEGFEDFPLFGKHQLLEAGVRPGDVVVAITEGGETPFVIGTAWQGLESGAEVFFVYNNPTELLRQSVQRSREVIEEPNITKLDLTTGPMAVAGSTRMQATSAELLVVGAALETALKRVLKHYVGESFVTQLTAGTVDGLGYSHEMAELVRQLFQPAAVEAMSQHVLLEQEVYERKGLVTYVASEYLLDVLTDTTERSPTFRLPPFRKKGDVVSARSWAFVKDPLRDTPEAWRHLLRRAPRGLTWSADVYRRLQAPLWLQNEPPSLDNSEIHRFQIGNEPDPSRTDAPDSVCFLIVVGEEIQTFLDTNQPLRKGFERLATDFRQQAVLCVGMKEVPELPYQHVFHVPLKLAPSLLKLWEHLAVKLVLNIVSTATMARMGRVLGNWMIYVEPSNKKLIDRATRLIADLAGLSYEEACLRLFEALEQVEPLHQTTEKTSSPVVFALQQLGVLSSTGRRPTG